VKFSFEQQRPIPQGSIDVTPTVDINVLNVISTVAN
jgi:hypothetical protein